MSGSLSKHFADEKSDIDFFIITSANRLWIARTCMHLFKKVSYIAGKQHWFCMNYYVDEAWHGNTGKKYFYCNGNFHTSYLCRESNCFQNFIAANAWI